ncbi:hypothetical protein GCM10020229_84840 [Kitasatospora albolonga]
MSPRPALRRQQQKLIIGREMSHHPKLLIAAHPTRGVDVGAQAQIWEQIRSAQRVGPRGAADLRRTWTS